MIFMMTNKIKYVNINDGSFPVIYFLLKKREQI